MKMNDSLLINLNDSEQNQIRYHSRECYKPYILKAERFRVITANNDTPTNDTTIEDDEALPKRSKRRKCCDSDINCIICHQKKIKNDEKLCRICEAERANMFRFNLDDVFSRASIYTNKEQLFAADVLYHKNCMNRYMLNDATEDNTS